MAPSSVGEMIGAVSDPRCDVFPVPQTHAELLDQPLAAVLTTHTADGWLQCSVVWFWREGDDVLISTMAEFYKAKNLRACPRATLLVVHDDGRWVEVRGEVLERLGDPMADLDAVGQRYTGLRPYFGAVVPAGLSQTETPVTFRICPHTVVTGPSSPARPRHVVGPGTPLPAAPRSTASLPPTHLDLFDRPLLAALATRMPDGAAQVQPTWCGREGDVVVVATVLERRKGRNLLADPRATVLVIDPADSGRWIEVRGDVELTTADAVELLDRLTAEYTGQPGYYGHVAPPELAGTETRVTARVHPVRVVCDAIHA